MLQNGRQHVRHRSLAICARYMQAPEIPVGMSEIGIKGQGVLQVCLVCRSPDAVESGKGVVEESYGLLIVQIDSLKG